MLHIVSTLVLVIIMMGVYFRKTPKLHLKFMLTAFAIDLGTVLYIEITRHATEKVSHGMSNLLLTHIIFSVLVLVLYLVQIVLGSGMILGKKFSRQMHMKAGICFITCRLLNYVTSFFIVA